MSTSQLSTQIPVRPSQAGYPPVFSDPASGDAARAVPRKITYGMDVKKTTPEQPVSDRENVAKLLNELSDASEKSQTQRVRDLRDKLNDVREKLGDDKFKDILNQLMQAPEASDKWREFLKWLMEQLFPGASDLSGLDKQGGGGGGGSGGGSGGGGRVNSAFDRNAFPPGERMSDKPLTAGAAFHDYKPDNSNPGKKPDNIWSGFKQGPDGNCVTVSAIKAAMMRFGEKPTDVFSDVKETEDGYHVTLRDGETVDLTKDELKEAAKAAQFEGDDPAMLTSANFMYAVSAKRAQKENNDGYAGLSFSHALHSLKGENESGPQEAFVRLGLKNHIRSSTAAELASGQLGVINRNGHSLAVIGGHEERWGTRGGPPPYEYDNAVALI